MPRARRPSRDASALMAEGLRLLAAGDPRGAAGLFARAARLAPGRAELQVNLGIAHEQAGDGPGAEGPYRRALDLDPDLTQARLNLAGLLMEAGRFAEAEALHLEAPGDSAACWGSLGRLRILQHRESEAEACLRRSLDLDPGHGPARFNLSYLLLRQGRFAEGWPAYEARPWLVATAARIAAPRWLGEPLEGRALLIGPEGGLGDLLFAARFPALLKARGAGRIGMVAPLPLVRLLGSVEGLDLVIPLGGEVGPGWDLWCLPLSLPGLLGVRADAVPAPIPYLRPRPEPAWADRLPPAGPRVGLCWAGNPRFENDAARSLPGPEALAPLAGRAGTFVSLQVGRAVAGTDPLPLFDPSPWISDLADTAALLQHLDLVVTVDTAVAHLAGALGRPCWVLLSRHKPDWRWFEDREDSPWYPQGMRLLRQGPDGAWPPVLARVAEELAAWEGRGP